MAREQQMALERQEKRELEQAARVAVRIPAGTAAAAAARLVGISTL